MKLYRRESDGKAKLRLLALIKRREGLSYEKIGKQLKIPKVYDWINNVDDEGLKRIHDQKRSVRPAKLTIEQESMLKKEIKYSPVSDKSGCMDDKDIQVPHKGKSWS